MIRPEEVVQVLRSPGFAILPQPVRHADLVPPEAESAMGWARRQVWFPGRDVRLCVLQHVWVAGEGLVLREDGSVVRQTIQQHSEAQIAVAQAAIQGDDWPRLSGTVILARKPGAQNYGHWLVEMLPRAALARSLADRVMVQKTGPALAGVMREGLALLGFEGESVIEADEAPVWVERLVVVNGLSEHGCYLSPLVLRELGALAADIPAGSDQLLFITRVGARRMVDEQQLAAAATLAGFTVVDPAGLSFAAQIALFKGARRIVAVMGAGLANMVFAPRDAEVFVLAPAAMPDNFFWFLAGLRGQRLLEIRCRQMGAQTGQEPWDTDLWLETEDLARILDPQPLPPRRAAAALERDLLSRFDSDGYTRQNPDVAAAGLDPLRHYLEIGWREGRNPSGDFDTRDYLAQNPAAVTADINPLIHAILAQQGKN